ncbi:DUF6998 domain-containing protein [Pseudomonas sp. NPDC047961]
MNLATLSTHNLLKLQAAVIGELKVRGILRTKNNPVGDYAEWLVASALNLKLAKNSAAGHDAESDSGKKIQIKARRVTADNKSRQLGVIRNLEKIDFDELVAVIFNESYEVIEAVSIPHSVIAEYSTFRPHVNGHVLHVRGALLSDNRIRNICVELNAANNALKSLASLAGTGEAGPLA